MNGYFSTRGPRLELPFISGFSVSATSRRRNLSGRRGFSLVEVTMAIGIVAFAFVALFALLPTGMGTFRRAMETSVCVQIAQRVINDAQQTDFTVLVDELSGPPVTDENSAFTFRSPHKATGRTRFFNDQGDEVIVNEDQAIDPTKLTADQRKNISYWVNTRIMPRAPLPGLTERRAKHTACITVQIAFNPANTPIPIETADPADPDKPGRNLFKPGPGVSVITYSAMVGRNL